ncbi:MAG: DAK2 domain-containing protein [Jatrophihabitantaceae bacterium]
MLEALDADAVRRWSVAAVRSLDAHRAEIDDLNVFPVPDRDTGTNLALTVRAGADALAAAGLVDAGSAIAEFARGAVLEARGNSGVIVAQLLRGMADAADGAGGYGCGQLRAGLAEGVRQAYLAVADPVEGTILTVARAAADALPAGEATLAEMLRAAVDAAQSALGHTPEQLPTLARAGVVDAGGRGLVLLLDALECTVTGAPSRLPATEPAAGPPAPAPGPRETGSPAFEYEVQYLLDAPDELADAVRSGLARIGDSVVVAGTGDGTWNVHAHVNDVGAAIEAGVAAGVTRKITVVRFSDEPAAAERVADEYPADEPEREPGRRAGSAVVAVSPGEGTTHLFAGEGVTVVEGSSRRAVTTADVVTAVRAAGAAEVVLLPNASQATGVAEAAADQVRADRVRVAVVPTRSPVQGLAAIAVHDPTRRFDDDVVAMAEAAAATRFAELTVATEESLTSVGICQAGDILGLIDGEVVEIGRGLVAVALAVVDRLLGVGAEIMTVLVGAEAPAGVGELVARHVHERAPLTDVTVYSGGQPTYPLIIGVE